MARRVSERPAGGGYLDGRLLIAMPGMQDTRFSRTVIYVCAHSADGAMGIMINQLAPQITFRDLLVQLDIIPEGPEIRLPGTVARMRVHRGGPVEQICLTATLEILKAIATGSGPEKAMLALGYAGWAPGQLENEIQANGWLHCDAPANLIFDPNLDDKYGQALAVLGVDPARLSGEAGHA